MSVYNGFGTRMQETAYNKTLYNLIFLLQLRITKESRNEPIDDTSFRTYFKKLYLKMYKMEEYKFLPPKYSFACKDLATLYNVNELSTAKSTMSKTSSNLSIVSVPGMKDNPVSPKSNIELQTIKEAKTMRKNNGNSIRPNSIRSNGVPKTSPHAIYCNSPVPPKVNFGYK